MSVTGNLSLKVQQICVDGSFVKATRILNRDLKLEPTELAMIAREITRLNEQVKHTPKEKWCSCCGKTKAISAHPESADYDPKESDFSPKLDTDDGYHPYCKDCRKRYRSLKYQEERREKRNQRHKSVTQVS